MLFCLSKDPQMDSITAIESAGLKTPSTNLPLASPSAQEIDKLFKDRDFKEE